MYELISKEDFARIVSEKPSLSLKAYMTCPVCCSSSYDICVSTIKQGECRRYEDFKAVLRNNPKEEEAKIECQK
jgi:hypothetical protein